MSTYELLMTSEATKDRLHAEMTDMEDAAKRIDAERTVTDAQIDALLDTLTGNSPLRLHVMRDTERTVVRRWLETL